MDSIEKLERTTLIDPKFIHLFQRKASHMNGVGISALSMKDFSQLLREKNTYLNMLFTPGELKDCINRFDNLTGYFASKVAVRKALKENIPWQEMNIFPLSSGQPLMALSKKDVNVFISITHDRDIAAAFAVCRRGKENVAIGIDIIHTSRFTQAGLDHSEHFLERFLTKEEYGESKNNVIKIAEKWSAKEAVSKALGTGISQGIRWRDIEIVTRNNKNIVKLYGEALAHARQQNIQHFEVFFQHIQEAIFAFVIASV